MVCRCAGLTLVVGSLIDQLQCAGSHALMVDGIDYLARLNHFPKPSTSWTVDLVPAAIGIVLLVIAMAFNLGERLQRDTEGLV